MRRIGATLLFSLAFPAMLTAETPKPCSAPEHRQFDFWVGDWDVAAGPKPEDGGRNTIDVIQGGCVLREQWRGGGGGNGTSLNAYDAARGVWHQTWVDDRGGLLVLEGGMKEGKMVLTGTHRSRRDPKVTVTERIAWTPVDADHVRQVWDSSTDGGVTWKNSFDGLYKRRK